MIKAVLPLLILAWTVVGCSGGIAAPSTPMRPSATPSSTPISTLTPEPTRTPTPEPTAWITGDALTRELTAMHGYPWMDNGDSRVNVATGEEFMSFLSATSNAAMVFVKAPYLRPAEGYILAVAGGPKGVQTVRETLGVLEPKAVDWAVDAIAARTDQDVYASPRGSILIETKGNITTLTFTPAQ